MLQTVMTKSEPDTLDLELLREICRGMKDFSLCNFTGKCESETMCEQTVQAAVHWLDKAGMPISFPTRGVFEDHPLRCVENLTGYQQCLHLGYFREEWIDQATLQAVEGMKIPSGAKKKAKKILVIYPTNKLLNAVKKHWARKR